MMLEAQVEIYRQPQLANEFEKYQKKAYGCFNESDYNGFIYYSNCALSTDCYTDKLYYDCGIDFEIFHEYRKAKKEYKKAIKAGAIWLRWHMNIVWL